MILNSEDSECFDPTPFQEQTVGQQTVVPDCSPKFIMEEQVISYSQQEALGFEYQQQMGSLEIDIENQMVQENGLENWETQNQEMSYTHQPQMVDSINTHQQSFMNSDSYFFSENPCPQTTDLLNLLQLPKCSSSLLPSSSISFTNPNQKFFSGDFSTGLGSSNFYDPMSNMNLPPQPPSFEKMFHQSFAGTRSVPLFGGAEVRDGATGDFDHGVFEFSSEMNFLTKGREGKDTKHLGTERQRRVDLSGKYSALKELIPSPTKGDRASIVGDAINYIKELQRTVNEVKIMVEKKRYHRERLKRFKTEEDSMLEVENSNMNKPNGEFGQACNGPSLRSSWLQRKSKNTEVDVRIIDDEVTIKLVQQKRINSLLFVAKVLDELQLDLQHVAGGLIGDYYSFMFNSKICESSSVYASAIANKLIDVVDRQYAAPQTSSNYS